MSKKNGKKWVINGSTYSHGELPQIDSQLPLGVYQLNFHPLAGFSLERLSDDFILPEKVYDSERDLIDRVKKTFNGFNKNFGILLKGLKGTGKTITGKQISNELKLPVILVNRHYSDMGSFINAIDQDVILFFDEFEKTYELSSYSVDDGEENSNDGKQGIGALLTLMDGVFTSEFKRLFILTTNKEYMPDAIMSRPSRIRYVKDFTDISYEGIMEILNDVVTNKELIPGLLLLMKGLSILTVDIVKCIAEEANLYNTNEPEFFTLFNMKRQDITYDIFEVNGKDETIIEERTNHHPTKMYSGRTLSLGDSYVKVSKVNHVKMTFSAANADDPKSKLTNYVFKKRDPKHSSFDLVF